jgi:hypothetical protein
MRFARHAKEGSHVVPPESWQVVDIGDVATIEVPASARDRNVQPIDSIVGILDGDGYEVLYEYGIYGRPGVAMGAGQVSRDRTIDGRAGMETSYRTAGDPWKMVRILQLQDGRNVLSVQVSCLDETTCALADRIFDSVSFRAG